MRSSRDGRQAAELRSAWTAEGGCPYVTSMDGRGARPHTGKPHRHCYWLVNNFKVSAFQRIAA
jgi:hypothetical protein